MISSLKKISPPVFLIVEDHEALRNSLVDLIRTHYPKSSIHECSTEKSALKLAKTKIPQICIIDNHIKHKNGHELAEQLKAVLPYAKMFLLSMHKSRCKGDDTLVIDGFVDKENVGDSLLPKIKSVLKE